MQNSISPEEQLGKGAELLRELLEPVGFSFGMSAVGNGSGGRFAVGEFVRGSHRLELHYRFGLGIVIYHVGSCSLSHEELMRALGKSNQAEYPTVLDKSLRGFQALAADLRKYGAPFLTNDSSRFNELVKWCAGNPRPTGFNALPHK